MHQSVFEFVKGLGLKGKTLDVGSYDVNGSVKSLFSDYIGVDMREGPNVDMIATADNLPFANDTFDNVVCLEMFEHDKRFWKSIVEMNRVLKPGGTLVITARGIGFPKHDYPYDLFRFTVEGLHTVFESASLDNIKVVEDPQASGVFGIGQKQMPGTKQVVGISFSSRNRPDTLKICLDQMARFLSPEKYDYVITGVIDLGDPTWDDQYAALMQSLPSVIWYKSDERMGVANAKNRGIKLLAERRCDHFFLFDDDVFPIKKGWEDLYINAAAGNSVHHLMHLIPMPVGFEIIRNEDGIREFSQCCGVLLYFTNQAIATVGGYRRDFAIYGHEHAELTLRSNSAGLQPAWGPYISPEETREYIYSLDLELNNWEIHPPDFVVTPEMWRSSIQGEDVQAHIDYNAQFFPQREPIYEEI